MTQAAYADAIRYHGEASEEMQAKSEVGRWLRLSATSRSA